ncbi:hypothetical protein [Pandoraea commovens]|uniref:Phage protein n=1 Tax=Pandoraea commovens TaxID=2508289 RepID=A0ABY5QI48_9BURK|nr:hypothetical protein [Pandoraea commovens]UVA80457.1 hypothetical protein NTU39_05390 [Pandoraea commovens]
MTSNAFVTNADQIAASMRDQLGRQFPFAASMALNRTINAAKAVLLYQMRTVFDRPTPYTLNALRTQPATKRNLEARVWFKDDTYKGTPATKYLPPQVYGGTRSRKRVEMRLQYAGLMSSDQFVMPGQGAQLDAYGNVSRGQYQRILSQLKASADTSQNETARSRKRRRGKAIPAARYFVARPGGHLKPGVYEARQFAHGSAIRPILIFARQPHYQMRFQFYGLVQEVINETLPDEMRAAAAYAIATAR